MEGEKNWNNERAFCFALYDYQLKLFENIIMVKTI